ncbi:MAG TPA: alpha/beta fold hydrolase [Steroidobacteraceae bacterium]|nr:alpha/beta fold hydrolase [Steroidobacteraceae bacterium]
MFRLFIAAATLLAFHASAAEVERVVRGNLAIEGIPEIPQELIQKMRRYQFARGSSFEGWTPDGRITISTRFGNTNQLHVVDRPMGARAQLTFFDEPVNGGSWSPTGARKGVVYVRDSGGNENFQLEYLDPAAADPVRLTDGRGRVGTGVWSPDGTKYAFQWTARTGVATDVYIDDPLDRRLPELVFEAPAVGWNAVDWSPDGKSLLLIHFVSINESYLWTYDLATREKREIEPAKVKAARGGKFSRDGKGVYIASDLGSEFRTLRYVDLASGKVTPLTDHVKWGIDNIALSKDGRYLAYLVNEDGASRIGVMDLVAKKDLTPPQLPFGVIGSFGFDPESKRLAFGMQTPNAPSDVWVWTVADGGLARWTQSEIGPIDAKTLVAPTLAHYPTFDKVDGKAREIPAWVYRPAGSGPHPVLISIHGGPEAQSRPIFSTNVQQWVAELGYAVILPNVRGSAGYGKTYVALDNGYKREDSVRDIGALLDWIATQDDLDASRVVLIGGSYGGYMVLSSMTHYNDRLRGAIDIVGISNFVTFLESTAEYRRDLRRPEYGDERDPKMREFLQKISPLNNTGKINKPMLIVQGQNDPRVPVTESEQMVAKIRANGGEVWYLVGLNEGHGFAKRDNVDYYQWAVALFLEKLK